MPVSLTLDRVLTRLSFPTSQLKPPFPPTGIWTQLALAYAIHKSFIFIRVPLTAAITPKVVKVLRGWGWNIGKIPQKNKAAIAAKGKEVLGKKN